jgi:prevent-host-death family protein
MENVTLEHAKEHLEELIERARRGQDIRITDAQGGEVRLIAAGDVGGQPRKPRRLGLLEGKMQVPARLMEPMSDEELRDWYGADA